MVSRSILPTLCLRAKAGLYVNKYRTVSPDIIKKLPDAEKRDDDDNVFKAVAGLSPLLVSWTSDSRAACADSEIGLCVLSRADSFVPVPLPTPEHLSKLDIRRVRALEWDPTGSMLVVGWSIDSNRAHNAAVFYVPNRAPPEFRGSFYTRKSRSSEWPIFRWTPDGSFAFYHDGDKVALVGGRKLLEPHLMDLTEANITSISVCDSATHKDKATIAIFKAYSAEAKRQASVVLIQVDLCRRRSRRVEHPLGRADECCFRWNRDRLLLTTTKLVDERGENYDSVTDCWLVSMTTFAQVNSKIVQDVAWNPVHDSLVLIEGKAPSQISLLKGSDLSLLHSFPTGYRNTVKWNSKGTMLALGGFGNMAGDLSLWYTGEERPIRIAEWREECCVVCEWSPCDTYLVTASTFPRMKVDNYMRLYSYEGHLLVEKILEELYEVAWTKPSGTYPDLTPRVNPDKQPVERELFKPRANQRELDARLTTATRYPTRSAATKTSSPATTTSQPAFTRMGGETAKGTPNTESEVPVRAAKSKAKSKAKAKAKSKGKKSEEVRVKDETELQLEKPAASGSGGSPPAEEEFPPLPGSRSEASESLTRMAHLYDNIQLSQTSAPRQESDVRTSLVWEKLQQQMALAQATHQSQQSQVSPQRMPSHARSEDLDLRERLLRMIHRPGDSLRREQPQPAPCSDLGQQLERLRARERLLMSVQQPSLGLRPAMSLPTEQAGHLPESRLQEQGWFSLRRDLLTASGVERRDASQLETLFPNP